MRVFAFGCSLTQYFYPTWADILIHEYEQKGYQGSNWAKSGVGNQYINSRLWEANAVHKFNKDDIILLQWSSFFREDRYHMGEGWHAPGNFSNITMGSGEGFVLNNFHYPNSWKWADLMHCVMRDCAIMSATHKALEFIGCNVISTHFRDPMEGWHEQSPKFNQQNERLELEDIRAVLESYGEDIATTCPALLTDLGFDMSEQWLASRPKTLPNKNQENEYKLQPEMHPLPVESATFIENHIEKLSSKTTDFVNNWQSYFNTSIVYQDNLPWNTQRHNYMDKHGWSDDIRRP